MSADAAAVGEMIRQDAESVLAGIRVKDGSGTMLVIPRAIAIQNPEHKRQAAELRGVIVKLLAEADKTFDPSIQEAHRTWKARIDDKRMVTADLEAAREAVDAGMGAFDREQKRLADEASAAAAEKLREASKAVEEQKTAREELAQEAEAGGDVPLAQELRATPVESPMDILPQIPSGPARVEGLGVSWRFKAAVQSIMELVAAVHAGMVPSDALEPNMTFLNARARKVKKDGAQICPGVVCCGEPSYSSKERSR